MNHILDLIPNAANSVVHYSGVPILCDKIQKFEYIDVAENAIRALEKISHDHADVILDGGALSILLNIIDFFVSPVQVKFK